MSTNKKEDAEQRHLLDTAAGIIETAKLEEHHARQTMADTPERKNLLDMAANFAEEDKLTKYQQHGRASAASEADLHPSTPTTTQATGTSTSGGDIQNTGIRDIVAGNEEPGPAAVPLPLPGLRRDVVRRQQVAQPGAFSGGGDHTSLERNTTLDYGLLGVDGNGAPPPMATYSYRRNNNPTNTHESGNDGLVEAREVDEEHPNRTLPTAHEYNPNNPSTNKHEALRPLGLLCFVSMVALLVGLYFVVVKNDNESSQEEELVPTSPSPTSLSPSLSPSAAPSAIMDDLLEVLPNYTRTSLQNSSSPQFRAWQWLENHRNITGMHTWRKEQLFAMAAFFYAMDGENWIDQAKRTWMNDEVSECLWYSTVAGILTYEGQWTEHVSLDLATNNLNEYAAGQPTNCDGMGRINAIALQGSASEVAASAHVPPELSMLSSLILLDLSSNFFGGKLESFMPAQLFEMTNLRQIDHAFNYLAGSFPTAIVQLTNLQFLDFMENSLTGTLPSEIGKLTSLEEILFVNNAMTGTLPTELGMLRNITEFSASQTFLSGTISTELGQWEKLESLAMSYSPALTGPIPTDLGRLTMLTGLYLHDCSFTGTIPTELGLLTNVRGVHLRNNLFSGGIPSDLGLMEALEFCVLEDNGLTGIIPSEILKLESLGGLSLSRNSLSGTIPTQIGLLQSLLVLRLEGTHLSGGIPSEIGLLTTVIELYLSNNPFLTGPLPTEIGLLTAVRELYQSNNPFLTGSLPTEIGLMTDLMNLELANNTQLTGAVPSELGGLVSAFNLSVVNLVGAGNLTGELDESICFMQSPNCTYKQYWFSDPTPCALEFDCPSGLCGCDCDCTSGG